MAADVARRLTGETGAVRADESIGDGAEAPAVAPLEIDGTGSLGALLLGPAAEEPAGSQAAGGGHGAAADTAHGADVAASAKQGRKKMNPLHGVGLHGFQRGIDTGPRRWTPEALLGSVVYVMAVLQVVVFFNAKCAVNTIPESDGGPCPEGWHAGQEFVREDGKLVNGGILSLLDCVSPELKEDMEACEVEALAEAGDADKPDLVDRVLEHAKELGVHLPPLAGVRRVESDIFTFLVKNWKLPALILVNTMHAGVLWFGMLRFCPRVVIAVSAVMMQGLLLALPFVVWFLGGGFLWPCPLLAVIFAVWAFHERESLNELCGMLDVGLEGLFKTRRIFLVLIVNQVIWYGLFVLSVYTLEVFCGKLKAKLVSGTCVLIPSRKTGLSSLYVLGFAQTGLFVRNSNLIVITAVLSGWYFGQKNCRDLVYRSWGWSFGQLSGASVLAAWTMVPFEALQDTFMGTATDLAFTLMDPPMFLLSIVMCKLKSYAARFTRYTLIAQVYASRSFCRSAWVTQDMLHNTMQGAYKNESTGGKIMKAIMLPGVLAAVYGSWAWADAISGFDWQRRTVTTEWGYGVVLLLATVLQVFVPLRSLVGIVAINEIVFPMYEELYDLRGPRNYLVGVFVGISCSLLLDFFTQAASNVSSVMLFLCAVSEDCNRCADGLGEEEAGADEDSPVREAMARLKRAADRRLKTVYGKSPVIGLILRLGSDVAHHKTAAADLGTQALVMMHACEDVGGAVASKLRFPKSLKSRSSSSSSSNSTSSSSSLGATTRGASPTIELQGLDS